MDADNVMSPFEYDVNPWNGWDVNDDYANNTGDGIDRRLVWGCERPELLITETLAFHDRRVADTDFDDGNGKKRSLDPTKEAIARQLRSSSPSTGLSLLRALLHG